MENPKIRFKMDNGLGYPHWRSKSFEEVFSPLNNNTFSRDMLNYEKGTAKNIHYGDILTNYGAICDVSSDMIPFVNGNIAYEKYDCLQNGDVILADTAEDETVGKAIELQGIKCETVISGLHTMACRPKQKYAPKYLGYLLNSPAFHNQLFPYMQGIKVTSIGRKNIASVKISYPCPAEQEKIADFLSSVDEVIIQSEKEVQNLEQQKKAAMQKIFSQKVRFKREDGSEYPEWTSKQISEFANCFAGATPSTKIKAYWENGTISWLSSGEVNKKQIFETDKKISQLGFEKCSTKMIKPNSVVMALAGQGKTRGTVAITRVPICTNQSLCAIETDDTIVDDYLYQYLGTRYDDLRKISSGDGTRGGLNLNLINNYFVSVPCLEEQQKIADFLSAFDEAIDYAKQELEKWNELKKGLLQQMFV